MTLTLAYSPCPNDTFMFHPIAAGGLRGSGYAFTIHLHDVETLNRLALEGAYDVTKISFHAWLLARRNYQLLDAGAALGFGCGPLLVARQPLTRADMPRCRIAVPGELTTAHLLFRLWAPAAGERRFARYDEILNLVRQGTVDAGILIHETRFTYREAGLTCVADLGAWWEAETGQPIPLGCVVARRRLGAAVHAELESLVRQSIRNARAHPETTTDYVSRHARELDPAVQDQHIRMFVTDFSLDLGERGRAAVSALEQRAQAAGLVAEDTLS
jgi:1,4-dihydroxy-6-naphthoate synthase